MFCCFACSLRKNKNKTVKIVFVEKFMRDFHFEKISCYTYKNYIFVV